LLSDGAFKLYIHLCLTAERSTGLVQADHADLAEALGKSRRSLDEKLAAVFFERQVPIETIEHGILMACTRKYMTLLITPNSGLIASLSYFKDAIEEAAISRVSNDYWRYLRHGIDGLEKEWLQKASLSR
jgi:hypothetical protein